MSAELPLSPAKPGTPPPQNYAVVKLSPADDVLKLFQLLVANGYAQVSFVTGREPDVIVNGSPPPPILDSETSDAESAASALRRCSGESGVSQSSQRSTETGCRLPLLPSGERSAPTPPYSLFPGAFPRPALSLQGLLRRESMPPGHPPPGRPLCPRRQSVASRHRDIPYTSPATTQLRQRGSRAQSDDPNVFVACRLCQNKIMASRLSNLTNHVRRHSTLKQFQCCYCDYTHNEMAKVRLHMLHNHKDKDSQPIDNLSPEMQASWDILMRQCFPAHYQGAPKAAPVEAGRASRCSECGADVESTARLEHVLGRHLACARFACSLCDFDHEDQDAVANHLAALHAGAGQVLTRDTAAIADALVPRYFPAPRPAAPPPPVVEGEEDLRCRLCEKVMETAPPLSALLHHAKRHTEEKQFACLLCPYTSTEAAHVRSHHRLRHASLKPPLDRRSPRLQSLWLSTLSRCFPGPSRRLLAGPGALAVAEAALADPGTKPEDAPKEDVPVSSAPLLSCSVCQFQSESPTTLRSHLWKHKLIGDGVKATQAVQSSTSPPSACVA